MANFLSDAISPYLLEHARNPVNWYPWGDEALDKARLESKPIFLSIGYSACHWCHVMARESFENPEIASILNENFISIKVDREERPDLDQIYMSAVIALTGQGGWPLSVFLTPDLEPFFGGTYFPPVRHGQIPGFRDLILALAEAWKSQREEILKTGREIHLHLEHLDEDGRPEAAFTQETLRLAGQLLAGSYDREYGGWGEAPKFPQPMAVEFLIRRYLAGEESVLKPAVHTLRAMARGGMYDVVGGGFARYSTDPFWRVPHFEKMLYDNALLVSAYLHAWLITGEDFFQRIVRRCLDFVGRELTSPEGGFYSSLDADSEGEEGKFYVWTQAEIRSVLGSEAVFFEAAYGVTGTGNWEGRNVLQRVLDDLTLASRFKITPQETIHRLEECHSRLLTARSSRMRPRTDDKVLVSWNGLMLSAFAESARVLPASGYHEIAVRNAQFLLSDLYSNHELRHAWRSGRKSREVYLEDYAALILGLIELYQTDFDPSWFRAAVELAEKMLADFQDARGGFFDTRAQAGLVLKRPKELQDNASPAGNSLAAEALLKLSAFSDKQEWRSLAEGTLGQVARFAGRYPTGFARALCAADFSLAPIQQVAIIQNDPGASSDGFLEVLRSAYRPHLVAAASSLPPPEDGPDILRQRPLIDGKETVYVCEGFVCKQPVTEVSRFRDQIEKPEGNKSP